MRTGSSFLQLEQRFLPLDAPAIASHATIGPYYAMAGNRDGYRVGGAGSCHCAGCRRPADGLGDLSVGAGSAERESIADAPTLAAGTRSLEYPGEARRSASVLPSGGATRFSIAIALGRRGGAGRRETRALARARVRRRKSANWIAQIPLSVAAISMRPKGESARRITNAEPQSRPGDTCPASCPVATRCARTDGCWSCNRRRTWRESPSGPPAGCA